MSLIDELLKAAEEVVEKAKRPFVKKKVKRVIETGIEDCEEQKVDAQLKLAELRGEFVKDTTKAASILNDIVAQRIIIKAADETIEAIKEEQEELFK